MSSLTNASEHKTLLARSPKARRKAMTYKKSREVIVVSTSFESKRKAKTYHMTKTKHGKWKRFAKQKRCPKAPHNTTSFLMNFHKSETKKRRPLRTFVDEGNDSESVKGLLAYGSFLPKFKSIPSDLMSLQSYTSR